MTFTLTADQAAFQRDVRAFFAEGRVAALVRTVAQYPPGEEPALLPVYRWLGERRWLAVNWPKEYGGLDRGVVEAAIVTEEMTLAGVPDDAHVLSIDIVGMFLRQVGTDAQQAKHLPAIARGERIATVLFTEQECGSDLAQLTTRADVDGDGWRLYGSKVYNQKSQFGDVALCAARTTRGPVGMHGITLFLLPLRSPGVHIEPVPSMGNDRFNVVVIDGVRLTADDIVGEVDDGWRLINDLLQLERTGIDFHGKARRLYELVKRRAVATGRIADPMYASELAELDGHLRAGQAMAWEMVGKVAAGRPDPVASAMTKWYITEQIRRIVGLAMEVDGLEGALSPWDGAAPELGLLEAAQRSSPTTRLASGTSEIMLYVIASAGLGLL